MEMASSVVSYNSELGQFVAEYPRDNHFETTFVFPSELQDGDELPDLFIYNVHGSEKPFRFIGQYNESTDNLEFVLLGPSGFSYKISLQMDSASEDEAYLWKMKKHGETKNKGFYCEDILYIPRSICCTSDSFVNPCPDVMKVWTFSGKSMPQAFHKLRLKIWITEGQMDNYQIGASGNRIEEMTGHHETQSLIARVRNALTDESSGISMTGHRETDGVQSLIAQSRNALMDESSGISMTGHHETDGIQSLSAQRRNALTDESLGISMTGHRETDGAQSLVAQRRNALMDESSGISMTGHHETDGAQPLIARSRNSLTDQSSGISMTGQYECYGAQSLIARSPNPLMDQSSSISSFSHSFETKTTEEEEGSGNKSIDSSLLSQEGNMADEDDKEVFHGRSTVTNRKIPPSIAGGMNQSMATVANPGPYLKEKVLVIGT